jgi:chromosomal replication initiation ATPase DnaA
MAEQTNETIDQKVLQEVASRFGVTVENIKGGERAYARPRQVAIYLLKKEFGQKLKAIVELLGVKSASQVYVSVARVKELLKTDKVLVTQVDEVKAATLVGFVAQAHGEFGSTPLETQTMPASAFEGEKIQSITNIIEAVAEVCLGSQLLVSREPALAVLAAQRLAVYAAWEICGLSPEELARSFNVEPNDIYLSIGRMSVDLKRDAATRETLAKVSTEITR